MGWGGEQTCIKKQPEEETAVPTRILMCSLLRGQAAIPKPRPKNKLKQIRGTAAPLISGKWSVLLGTMVTFTFCHMYRCTGTKIEVIAWIQQKCHQREKGQKEYKAPWVKASVSASSKDIH